MNPKSIDERLEAITRTLEVVSHMQQASEERIDAGILQQQQQRGRELAHAH